MTKFEFIEEYNPVTKDTMYYTEKDGKILMDTLSATKDKAYKRFINVASGVELKPSKTVTETIYTLTD